MAVQTTTNRISYTGDGSTVTFTYPFRILAASHLTVSVAGAAVSNYTVAGVDNAAGGTITFTAAPANGAAITILRVVPVNQLVATTNNDTIFSQVFDLAVDKLTMIAQQIGDATVQLPASDPPGAVTLPTVAQRLLKFLGFNATGAPTPFSVAAGPGLSLVYDSATGTWTFTNIGVPGGGSGNVVGPASSVDKRAAAFSGTTGKVLVDSGVGLDTGTVIMTSSFQRNLMVNGDMRVNQRTGFVGSLAAGSTRYGGPDRWFASVLSGTTSLSFVALPANVQGVQNVLRLQRTAGQTNTGGLVTGQQIESDVIIPRQGKTCTLSFKARAGANFSALSSQITANCVFGTGINQPSIGAVGSTWTGWNNVAAVRTINTTLTQYTMTVPVPANATEAAVLFSFTPTGTAGAADFMEITEVQLEEGVAVTPFEILPFDTQLAMCRRRWRQAGAGMVGAEENVSTLSFGLSFNPPMAATPTISLANTSFAYRYINAAGFGDRTITVSLNGATTATANGAWAYINDTSNGSAAGRMAIERNGVNYFNVDADL